MKPAMFLALTILLSLASLGLSSEEPTLEQGIQQIKDGNFQAALVTLDALIGKLTPEAATHGKELSQTYLYKGVALTGLAKEEPAKAAFKEALKYDKDLKLSEKEFPRRVVRVFEAARKGKSKSVLYAGGGIGTALLIGGGIALASGSAALVAANQPITETFSGTIQCVAVHEFFPRSDGTATVTLLQLSGRETVELSVSFLDSSNSIIDVGVSGTSLVGVGGSVSGRVPGGVRGRATIRFFPFEGPACPALPPLPSTPFFSYTISVTHER